MSARTVRGVVPILRYARPHWRLILATFVLTGIQSLFAQGRVILIYPVLTRVIPAVVSATGGEEGRPSGAETLVDMAPKGMLSSLEDAVTWMNGFSSRWIPESWYASAVDPALTGEAREAALASAVDPYATLVTVLALFFLFIGMMAVTTYLSTYVAAQARLEILMDVREAICRRLLDQPVAFYDNQKRGELVQRVLGDVEGYALALELMLVGIMRGALNILVALALMVGMSWQLTAICLLGLPFLLPMRALFRRILKRSHKRQEETGRRVEVLLQIFSGIRTVKAYGTEDRRVREFRESDETVTYQALRVQRAKSTMNALMEVMNNSLVVSLAVIGGFLMLRGVVDVPPQVFPVFLLVLVNLYQPVKRFVKQLSSLQDAMASVERTTEYLELEGASPDAPDAIPFPGLREGIRFEGVGFAYEPGEPVLEDVTFEIPKGKTVALVGPSGGGKSTLCDLLLRFYDPDEGRITIDGHDVHHFQRSSLLSHTAVVTQAPFLFNTSIKDNILQGRFDATDEEIRTAAKAAQIHDYIASHPEGYDSIAGEHGVRLSGGQRQRITIARALVRNPEILVLDEATSSLDTSSEKAVQQALDRLQVGRTTLVVAHRLSTIRDADRIVVIDGGRVVAQGTHDELVAAGGLYADLVRMQDLGAPA